MRFLMCSVLRERLLPTRQSCMKSLWTATGMKADGRDCAPSCTIADRRDSDRRWHEAITDI